MIKFYCSSPQCRNKCGHKENKDLNYQMLWIDPMNCECSIFAYKKYCDDDGCLIKTENGKEPE